MNIADRNSNFLAAMASLADYRRADRNKQSEIRLRWFQTFEYHPDAQVRAAAKDLYRQTFKEGWVEVEDGAPSGMEGPEGPLSKGDLGA